MHNYTTANVFNVTAANSSFFTQFPLYNDTLAHEDAKTRMHVFNDVVGVGLTGIVCLLGLLGNLLSVIVLRRTFSNSPMFYVLRILSVSDGIFLLSVFVIQIVVNLHPTLGVLHVCFYYRAYIQYFVWPVMMTTQMTSVWLTVLVSCERYVAICYPLRAAAVCTIRKVRRAVIFIFVVAIVFNVPRYLEFSARDNADMGKTEIGTNEIYRYAYTCVLYAIALFFLPLIALFFLNVQLVIALQRGKKQWQRLQARQRNEQNLTAIPLSIVLIFFLCGTPALVVNISDSVDTELSSPFYLAFMVFANFLVVLNSASNIVVYFLLGRKFRSRVAEMFLWLCCCGGGGGGGGGSGGRGGGLGGLRSMRSTQKGKVERAESAFD